ncbi:MAG: ribonuclease HII, partial [bacterium]
QAEAAAMIGIIREVGPALAYVDALTSRPERFGRALAAGLLPLTVRVIAENRADGKFPLVAAASIVAKVTRDAALEALREAHGEIGSGYPGDPRTVAFLRRCLAHGALPPFVRRSWRTLSRLAPELS